MIAMDTSILQFDFEWREGSRELAISIAKEFIDRNRETLTPIYSKYDLDGLVSEITELRKCGSSRHYDRLVTDMWILSEYPLGNITGEIHATVKIPDALSRSKVSGSI